MVQCWEKSSSIIDNDHKQHGDPAEDVEGDEPLPGGGRGRQRCGLGAGGAAELEIGRYGGGGVAPDELVTAHGRRRPPLPAAPRGRRRADANEKERKTSRHLSLFLDSLVFLVLDTDSVSKGSNKLLIPLSLFLLVSSVWKSYDLSLSQSLS